MAKVLELQVQHQSFQWIFRADSFRLTGLISVQSKWLSRVFSSTNSKASVLQHSAFFRLAAMAQLIKNLPAKKKKKRICLQCRRPGFKPSVGKVSWRWEWQPTFSIVAWRVPGTEEPGGLQSMGPQSRTQLSDWHKLLYGPTLTSIRDHWKNHSFDCTDVCRQSDISVF